MDEYYYNLLINKLKDDIIKEISSNTTINCNEQLLKSVIEEYFIDNKVTFKDDKERYCIKESKTHKYRPRPNEIDPDKCIARIWNEGMGGQCSRKKHKEYGNFCKRHHSLGGYEWAFGTIDKPKEREILYKNKIHIWLN